VTNNHVIDGADQVKISLADKREFAVDVVLKDPRADLAVLRVKGDGKERFPVIDFGNSDDLQVGDVVLAVGNPFGVGQTVTHGIVSAVARTQVGISDYSSSSRPTPRSIPAIRAARWSTWPGASLASTPRSSRARAAPGRGLRHSRHHGAAGGELGALGRQRGQAALARRQASGADAGAVPGVQSAAASGVVITSVTDKGPAARAGLKAGDVIVSVGARRSTTQRLRLPLHHARAGRQGRARRGARRQGEQGRGRARDRAGMPRDEIVIEARSPFTGAKVANLSPALADELRLDSSTEGVVVVEVADGTLAQQFGFQRGDVLLGSTAPRSPRPPTCKRPPRPAPGLAHHHPARRPADFSRVRRMSSRPKRGAAPSLFAAAGWTTMRRGRWPTSCGRKSWPTSSARTSCSGRTAR
jgi:S1-C subfamily serine protease